MLIKPWIFFAVLLCLTKTAFAQQTPDDVIRTNTELVQSSVTVVDKSGHFVEGLSRDQFEVIVDGKPRSLAFFERITAGSAREQEVLLKNNPASATAPKIAPPVIAGRTIVFFIDDLHLSPDSLNRTRQMLRHFIDNEMSSSDNVAIATASGQLGFLEQFTNNELVLNAAVNRLLPRAYVVEGYGSGSSKMTEYMALAIDSSRSDDRVFQVHVEECLKYASKKSSSKFSPTRIACENQVKNNARSILLQAAEITQNTYNSLASLMRSSSRVPGRKLAFFVSDGFLLDNGPHAAAVRDRLDHVIDQARRAGVVIYSIHARGLVNANYNDAASPKPTDPNGRLDLASVGELQATQDALNALARDTGGLALRNTNYFERWVTNALDETSNYYLLAWRPEAELEKDQKFRNVKIGVIGRSDLTVRAPRGFVQNPTVEKVAIKDQPVTAVTPEKQIGNALSDFYSLGDVPVQLALTYLSTPANGPVVTSSIHIAGSGIAYRDEKTPATLQLAGVVLNDKGKVAASFSNQVNVNPPKAGAIDDGVFYTQHNPLAPGIYQVRVAARDEQSGRVGSALQWIVVPDLTKKQLATSSVLLDAQVFNAAATQVQLSVNHAFSRDSRLGYVLFVYNAKKDGSGNPHLVIQTTVSRAGQTMLTSRERKIDNVGDDPERLAFGEQLALQTLAPGPYDLKIVIKDTVSGTSVTQSDYFIVR
ncbi:MAG TPA: VWA domain-containing protein [Pyrinomonadaceae bacterium]